MPFTLVGGYLGAGKTTILNQLVGNAGGRRLVVLVNDLAAVNVDAALLVAHEGTTLTLSNGCVCCAIADDFAVTLEAIRAMDAPPDHILMELSGVGEPARVAPWANTTGFRLDGIVVAVDADTIVELADRPLVADTVRAQLAAADLVALTKVDLTADEGRAATAFVASLTDAPVIDATDGRIEPAVVLGLDRADPPDVACDRLVPRYSTEVLDVGTPTLAELDHLVASLGPEIVRAKGVVACSDASATVEVQLVGNRRRVRQRPDLAPPAGGGRLVVIRFEPTAPGG